MRNSRLVAELHPAMGLLKAVFIPVLLFASTAAGAPKTRPSPDFPLALKTKWTYHLHQEIGEGVHFDEEDAKLAKGNSLDATVISEAVGTEFFGALKYTRVESRRNGKIWYMEWDRPAPEGLMVGKTIDYGGQSTVMNPPQKILSRTLATGESWDWKASRAPVTMHVSVVGPGKVTVPAGTFDAIEVLHVLNLQEEGSTFVVRQTRWFVPGVGYVKQSTETRMGDRMVARILLTLEKYEPAP